SNTQDLSIKVLPSFSSASTATFNTGVGNQSFTITTAGTGTPATSLAITGGTLPNGLSFTDNGNGTATVSVVNPVNFTSLANTSLTITATDRDGDKATQTLRLVLVP